jgi:hypothetical protein
MTFSNDLNALLANEEVKLNKNSEDYRNGNGYFKCIELIRQIDVFHFASQFQQPVEVAERYIYNSLYSYGWLNTVTHPVIGRMVK